MFSSNNLVKNNFILWEVAWRITQIWIWISFHFSNYIKDVFILLQKPTENTDRDID